MDKQTRDALEKQFPKELVKSRKGPFGKRINYVEGSAVVFRLNDCFDGEWSFRIVSHTRLETGEVLVHGRLEVLGITKEAFGRGAPVSSKETKEIISLADAYKQAVSDSIKRAARLLGVAAYLYTEEQAEPREAPPAASVTHKQLTAIWNMARSLGLSAEQTRKRCLLTFKVNPDQLSKANASSFICELGEELEARRGAA